ncbi:MAG: hypothetical protein IJW25_00980 [Clostridia bacterium]|nr:hypothetical protein [Clostridia bacterium]
MVKFIYNNNILRAIFSCLLIAVSLFMFAGCNNSNTITKENLIKALNGVENALTYSQQVSAPAKLSASIPDSDFDAVQSENDFNELVSVQRMVKMLSLIVQNNDLSVTDQVVLDGVLDLGVSGTADVRIKLDVITSKVFEAQFILVEDLSATTPVVYQTLFATVDYDVATETLDNFIIERYMPTGSQFHYTSFDIENGLRELKSTSTSISTLITEHLSKKDVLLAETGEQGYDFTQEYNTAMA